MTSDISIDSDLNGKSRVRAGSLNIESWVKAAADKQATQVAVRSLFEKTKGRELELRLTRHYQNLLQQIKDILTSGVGMEDSPPVSFKTVDGLYTQFDTNWEALTEEYQRRKRPQYRQTFWRNNTLSTGRFGGGASKPLLQSFNAAIKVSQYKARLEKTTVKRGSVKKTRSGASMVVSTRFRVDSLPEPLETLVREPFISGGRSGAVRIPRKFAGNKFDLSKIVFVEGRRPFISNMASILGRLMYDELSLT